MRKKTRLRLLIAAHMLLAIAAGFHIYVHQRAAGPANQQKNSDVSSKAERSEHDATQKTNPRIREGTSSLRPADKRLVLSGMLPLAAANVKIGGAIVVVLWMEFICYSTIFVSEVFPDESFKQRQDDE